MSGLWILILGGIMFMFVGGPVKEMAFAVGGAILFSGTYIPSYRHTYLNYYWNKTKISQKPLA